MTRRSNAFPSARSYFSFPVQVRRPTVGADPPGNSPNAIPLCHRRGTNIRDRPCSEDQPMSAVHSNPALRHIRRLIGSRRVALADWELVQSYLERGDETAFAALVERHGPMVLGVCRSVLRHSQDAEDAFQATFLVLARKANSIRRRNDLGSWLHGVAYRVSCKAMA